MRAGYLYLVEMEQQGHLLELKEKNKGSKGSLMILKPKQRVGGNCQWGFVWFPTSI